VPRHRAENALADLSKTGDNAGVDGAVVLLAVAAEAYATGGGWLSRLLGAATRYCTGGSDWRISASTASGMRGPHKNARRAPTPQAKCGGPGARRLAASLHPRSRARRWANPFPCRAGGTTVHHILLILLDLSPIDRFVPSAVPSARRGRSARAP
jgi:hypothetical protein